MLSKAVCPYLSGKSRLSRLSREFLSGKKIFLWSLFLIINYSLLITNCFSQLPPHYYWRVVSSPVQYNLNAISDVGNSYIVGDNGTLLRSINGGWSYSIITGLLNYNLNDIKYDGNFNRLTAVGDNGTIYYFSDVNIPTIILEPAGTTNNLFGIGYNRSSYIPPIFRRIAVGETGTIIQSTWNVGTNWSSWTPVISGTAQNLWSVDFYFNDQNVNPVGCAVGNNGTILRTTDCGDTWNPVNIGITNKLNSFRFTDSMTCWITGSNGLLMKSTNRGLNWMIIPTGTLAELNSFRISYISWGLTGYPAYYVCGNNGLILQSINQGGTWTSDQSYTQNDLNLISYIPYNNYSDPIIIGNSGTILHRAVDSVYYGYRILQGNNIKSYFHYSGIFDQNSLSGASSPGFEWPKGSNKYAIFTAGLSIAAYYQGALREAMASYKGEFYPGICNNEIAQTGDTFKLYSVKRGDSHALNPDWNNWGLMVPYGAPYVDVNNNGTYEPQIDTPGVKGASQTIFLCCTDGFTNRHNPGEGFGGGTLPLYSEVHLTAWCYSQLSYADMQFLKFVVINKSNQPWTKTYFALVSDVDLGNPNDDYTGCDTIRDLGYVYNGTNYDQYYGTAPPAAGFLFLRGAYNKYVNPIEQFGITSGFYFRNETGGPTQCEADPNGQPNGAYLFMKGYKKDSTCWLDPTYNPPKKTKVIYPGDPETNTGWTMANGCILNCNRDTAGQFIIPVWPHDMKIGFGSGAENLTVMPGDTQTIVICQLIAKGSSNLNSVTKLKQLADLAQEFYNSGYVIGINKVGNEVPTSFRLGQNYPNPFNPTTKIKFDLRAGVRSQESEVKLVIYDILGREIQTLVNEKLQPGTYEVTFDGSNFASGIYFYQLRAGDYVETKKMILLK